MSARARVIIDNDFSGDPDDLFQLAHHALSPSVEIPVVIGSHLAPGDGFDPSDRQADNAVDVAGQFLALMGIDLPVVAGSNVGLPDLDTPLSSAATDAIIHEALRDDTDLPLFLALGGGLTELASALLIEPRIAERLTAVWIGGPEHDMLGMPLPVEDHAEYNLAIDIPAGRVVFDSSVPLWQVPRDTYRQALVSSAELDARVRPHGNVGRHLAEAIDRVVDMTASHGIRMGETYALGDQPLVLLTALQSAFQPETSSSRWVEQPRPRLTAEGWYESNPAGAAQRVYTHLDNRLMFEDFYAKLARHAHGG